MKFRNNLSGKMMFKSFIPAPIADYQINVYPSKLQGLTELFKELNTFVSALSDEDRLQLIRMEATDSWRLADDKPINLNMD